MQEQLENRLRELRAELEVGQKVMSELEVREANLRSTLLRIGGAIQVLEELLLNNEEVKSDGRQSEVTTGLAPVANV